MAIGTPLLYAFNRGLISVLGLARTDLKRTALSAETMTNWMPRSLGSMMLRPGLKYIAGVLSNLVSRHIPFIFATDDTAIIELTNGFMRVLVSETVISRVSVTSAITNGTFNSNLTGWTDADETGASSDWVSGGWMGLSGTGVNRAIRRQTVTCSGANIGKEHALEIHVRWGPATLKVGTVDDADDYITKTDLGSGYHSLAFTPTGNFHIQLSSAKSYPVLVDYITIAAAGDMKVPTQITTALLPKITWAQSADVIFVAVPGVRQQKIERRGTRSWSMVDYQPIDGPFELPNTELGITITPSATTGQITLTASRPLFSPHDGDDNGPLWRLVSSGQSVTSVLAGGGQFSDPPVKVTGVTGSSGHARRLFITITGTWVGTIQLQRSIAEVGSWANVFPVTWTANVSGDTYDDGLDNQIAYYRLIFSVYSSGSATVNLTFSGGSITGVVRADVYTSSTSLLGEVVKPLGGTDATSIWSRGSWSQRSDKGFPSAVALHEGRLWWAGHDKIIGSVSDGFSSFDDQTVGDSGPIQRSIGSGPVDTINWLVSLQSLVAGGQAAEHAAHSTTFDEPLTPTNFQIKETSTQGSARLPAVKVDLQGLFIQRSGRRLFALAYDIQSNGYTATDLTLIIPEIAGGAAFVSIAVQRQPDTRIHCVRSDGKVAVLIFDPAEDLRCWVLVETDGTVEEVFVLPDDGEDAVYYVVNRTISSSTVRYLEKWAQETDCQGGAVNRQADSFIVYSGAAVTTITGLSTLQGKSVVVWADGKSQGTFTVSGGQITGLPVAVSNAVIGLAYTAQFKSSKLAYAAQLGTALSQRKRLSHVGLIMTNVAPLGITFGPDFTTMDGLPLLDDELGAVDTDAVWDEYDHPLTNWPGGWSVDSRICLQASAPLPVTVCGVSFVIDTEEQV